jgi:polysaccharide deacetylase family protein (PEP-CTERM system associated)
MTVDLEDYYHVSAFENTVSKHDWPMLPSRAERNVHRILELFEQFNVRATFFVLGWLAERQPHLVRLIHTAGHEIASHGLTHRRVCHETYGSFLQDATKSRELLQDITGQKVFGYRAASYSIDGDTLWAHDALAEAGYQYSSSIYPIHHDHYGMVEAPRFCFTAASGRLLEIPISTIQVLGTNFPCGGGGYFRLLPYAYFRWAIRRLNDVEKAPGVFYFHPWEIDDKQPRLGNLSIRTKFRHYYGISKTESKLRRITSDFTWDCIHRVFVNRTRQS